MSEQPSRVRHAVVLVSMIMSVLLYLDRFCVSLAEPYIKQSLNLSSYQMGFFFSAFFLTYALAQVPAGWLTDRFGCRLMLTLYILTWSLFTGLHAAASGFVLLLIVRAMCGLGQAGAYPTGASIVSKWVPFSSRGAASSYVALGGRLGGAVAQPLTALLIVMLVPVTVSSLFESRQLLDIHRLCVRLDDTGQSTPDADTAQAESDPTKHALNLIAARLFVALQPDEKSLVTRIAEQHRPMADEISRLEKEGRNLQKTWRFGSARTKYEEAERLRVSISDAEREQITRALNRVVEGPEIIDPKLTTAVKLDHSGEALRTRSADGGTLSVDEQSRLNRLLIESAFSGDLGDVYVSGWRPVMVIYALIGVVVAAGFWMIVRNRPQEHPRCTPAEVQLIESDSGAEATKVHGRVGNVPWARLLSSRSMWLNCFSQVGTNIGWVFIVTWFPAFLNEVYDVPILRRGVMAGMPLAVGWIGMVIGGRLTDRLVKTIGLRWARVLPWSVSRFVGVAAFITCPLLDSPWSVTVALCVVAISTDFGTPAAWAFAQDTGGRYAGCVLGWGNMWGNLGATVSPVLLAWVATSYDWNTMFFVCAGAFVFSGLCSAGIDASIPIAPPEDD